MIPFWRLVCAACKPWTASLFRMPYQQLPFPFSQQVSAKLLCVLPFEKMSVELCGVLRRLPSALLLSHLPTDSAVCYLGVFSVALVMTCPIRSYMHNAKDLTLLKGQSLPVWGSQSCLLKALGGYFSVGWVGWFDVFKAGMQELTL